MALIAAMAVPTAAVSYAAETEEVVATETETEPQQTESSSIIETEKESVLETVTETEEVRQTETETERQTEIETERQTEAETEKQTEAETEKQTETVKAAEPETEAPKAVETEIKKVPETEDVLLGAEVKGKPGPMTNLKISFASGKITLSWAASKDATGYTIYSYDKNTQKRAKICSTKKLTYTFDGTYGKEYAYVLVAYNKNVSPTAYSDYSNPVSVYPGKPQNMTNLKIVPGDRKVTLSWSSSKEATGYSIYFYDPATKKMTKKYASTKKLTYDVTGLENGKVYSFRIRPYNKLASGTVYGNDSSVITATPGQPPKITGLKASPSNEQITLSWPAAPLAQYYKIYMYNPSTTKWDLIKQQTGTSLVVTKLKNGTSYKFGVRAYNKIGNKTFDSGCSNVVTAVPKLIKNGWVTVGSKKYYYKDGNPIKKMQKVDGKYYFFDKKTGEMKTGWIYYGGYKFYFDKKTGVRSSDVSGLIGKQKSYIIRINKAKNCVTVYAKDGSNGYTIPVKAMICSVGTTEHETPTGTFYTKSKWRWQILMGPTWGQWVTQIYGGIYFHSVYYTRQNNNNSLKTGAYNNLGKKASHGCVRLTCKDAKWLYDKCSSGTKVVIYNDSKVSGPLGKPSAYKLDSWHTWDPTDPNMAYKCKQRGCH